MHACMHGSPTICKMQDKTNISNESLHGYMINEDADSEQVIPDLLGKKHDYLFRTIGREGKYSLELKCFLLVMILLVPCLLANLWSRTLYEYSIRGWGHFLATIFTGVFAWLLIRFLKKMDGEIRRINQILSPPRKERNKGYEEWKSWKLKIQKYKKWALRIGSYKWYYFAAIVGSVCGFIFSMRMVTLTHGWALKDPLKMWYLRAWYVFYGFFLGISSHYIILGYNVIRKYCKDVISHEEIIPLDPDHTGGLRELGRLSLDLDLIVALPSVAFPIYFLRFRIFEFFGYVLPAFDVQSEIQIATVVSLLYALLLISVFFVSISPAHDDMIKAKNNYLLKIHKEYKDMHENLLRKLETKQRIEPKEYNRLSGLYELYDRVESMAVWPLDFRTVMRFAITSSLPLISVGISMTISI